MKDEHARSNLYANTRLEENFVTWFFCCMFDENLWKRLCFTVFMNYITLRNTVTCVPRFLTNPFRFHEVAVSLKIVWTHWA